MKKLFIITTILLFPILINATTIYYNGEGNDIGEWFIQENGSHESASLTEVFDNTLNSTVMQFSEAGIYRLRLPNHALWDNHTERVISFDVNMDTYYTIYVYVNTLQGVRKLFYNPLNVHAGHHNNQHLDHVGADGTGIINSFGRHRTHRDNRHHDRGWLNHPLDKNNRNGWVRVTLDLERDLRDTEPNNHITSVFSLRIAGSSGMIDNVTLDNPTRVTKSTLAEDWNITTGVEEGGVITVENDDEQGSVIKLVGTSNSSSFTTGAKDGDNSWNDTTNDIIQWKIKTENWFKVIVHVNTINGLRDMVYFPERRDRRFDSETSEIGIGVGERRHLGDASPDNNNDGIPDYDIGTGGTWQTFTRNVAMDVTEYENSNKLISINGVTVIGTNSALHNSAMIESDIEIDDLELFKSIIPTSSEMATNINSSNIQQNSATISFTDRANGESGFRLINETTGVELAQTTTLDGVGETGNFNLTELTSNTTYQVRVETTFDDGRDSIKSQLFEFTTLEEPISPSEAPNDLHRWRLRETSVRISFMDNANSETNFRFINADTGVQLGDNLPATEGTGTASIGQINGLTAGTTYHIQVEALFDDGRESATSDTIIITTLGTPPPPEDTHEEATDLHRWRLRETSVRISFMDNANGETSFRFINADTGVQMGDNLPATEGTGTASIGSITGLTAGTTYHIQVQTLFDDGRETATSEAIEFTTEGEAEEDDELIAVNDLHTWRLRSTSVKISFSDQSEGESGFRFINADTEDSLRDDLPATDGVGTASIGRINNLTANTTYHVQIQTLRQDGTVGATSEAIEFTTLAE